MLAILENEGSTAGELAELMSWNPRVFSTKVSFLKHAGLVTAWPAPNDHRRRVFMLGRRGKEFFLVLAARWREVLAFEAESKKVVSIREED